MLTGAVKYRVPFYRPARDTYNYVFRPRVHRQRARARHFMSRLVRPGHLVFDVGANQGEYTEMFDRLGARVIAIEPNAQLAELIRARVPNATVEPVAVGATQGEAYLWVGGIDGYATLSRDYLSALRQTLAVDDTRLDDVRPIKVPVTTLDTLIARYGVPNFVKIDVEGFEAQALTGLTSRVRVLSFEFHGSLLNELEKCLSLLPGYTFRIVIGHEFEWATTWGDGEAILGMAADLAEAHPDLFADVYAFS